MRELVFTDGALACSFDTPIPARASRGTRTIRVAGALCFRSSYQSVLRCVTNFGNAAPAWRGNAPTGGEKILLALTGNVDSAPSQKSEPRELKSASLQNPH